MLVPSSPQFAAWALGAQSGFGQPVETGTVFKCKSGTTPTPSEPSPKLPVPLYGVMLAQGGQPGATGDRMEPVLGCSSSHPFLCPRRKKGRFPERSRGFATSDGSNSTEPDSRLCRLSSLGSLTWSICRLKEIGKVPTTEHNLCILTAAALFRQAHPRPRVITRPQLAPAPNCGQTKHQLLITRALSTTGLTVWCMLCEGCSMYRHLSGCCTHFKSSEHQTTN